MAGCLETAPSGPGDTPLVDNSNAGGPQSVEDISISGGQTNGAGQNGGQTTDAGVSGTGGFGGTGTGGFAAGTGGFGPPAQPIAGVGGAGFTGTGGFGFGGFGFNAFPNPGASQPGVNTPPNPSFSSTPACLPEEQTDVLLTSTSIDADGDPLICDWTVPEINVTSDNGCSISGTAFSNAGAIAVELTVTDSNGASATARATLLRCPPQ